MTILFRDYDLLLKSGLFDPELYLSANPDLAELNIDPLTHYLEVGAREGRNPRLDFDAGYYLEQCRDLGETPVNPLVHFVTTGARRGLKTQRGSAAGVLAAAGGAGLVSDPETGITLSLDRFAVERASDAEARIAMDGWAIGTVSPVEEITAYIGDALLGFALYGLPRADVARQFPRYERLDHCGFSLSAYHLLQHAGRAAELRIEVRTAAGHRLEHRVPMDEAALSASGRDVDFGSGSDLPPIQLQVDESSIDLRGVINVSGWCVCFAGIEAVEIFVNEHNLGRAEYGRHRKDVGAAFPRYPGSAYSGFAFVSDISRLGPGKVTMKVRALAKGGAARELLIPIFIPDLVVAQSTPEASFHFNCDRVELNTKGGLVVAGWAIAAKPLAALNVYLDNELAGEARCNLDRPDVGNVFPQFPTARRSGFAFQGRIDRSCEGEHVVRLEVQDADGRIRNIPLPIHALEAAADADTSAGTSISGEEPDRILSIDLPRVVNGAAESPIRGGLSIAGWGLARSGVSAIDIAIDGKRVATAHHGIRRPDVASHLPAWEDSLLSGFIANVPSKALSLGRHVVTVTLRDKQDAPQVSEFRIDVEEIPEDKGPWSLRRKMAQAEIDLQHDVLARLAWRPQFQLVLPLRGDDKSIAAARKTLASLATQAYAGWSLSIVPTASGGDLRSARKKLLEDFDDIASRVQLQSATSAGAQIKRGAGKARGRPMWFCPLIPGIELGCDALLELALASGIHHDADFVYSDERCRSPVTGEMDAYFKPQWSPDLLLSTNYVGAFWAADLRLLESAGMSLVDWLRHGTYDAVLRLTEAATAVRHVPKVLSERRGYSADTPAAERKALQRALKRRGIRADIRSGCADGIYRVQRRTKFRGLVSIIIPTCASRGLIKTCIDTLRKGTAYRNFEIVCIENIPAADVKWKRWLRRNADVVVGTEEPFNWSRFNNLAVAQSKGEFLLFLNDDIEIIEPGWLDAMLEHAERPEVGAVGPQLLYPNRSVQHAALVLNDVGKVRHAFRHADEYDPGYFGMARTQRNVIGVTGGCLLTRRDVYEAVGRFDEAHKVINNDLDYCLKTWSQGLLNVFTPHAKLIHHEMVSRSKVEECYDTGAFESQWRNLFLLGDPYFNPNLSRNHDDFCAEREPVQMICAGHPLYDRASIRRILVVKVDHIGDCMTALSAVRRLRKHFPKAHIAVLSAKSSKVVWESEKSVDEVIEFNFFHARSGLGKVEVTADEFEALNQKLSARRFDLAVDLRKQPDTRHILKYTGARFLAGLDHQSQCPWLDIALEWEGDQPFQSKHTHVTDDLIRIVDALASCGDRDRQTLSVNRKSPLPLPAEERKRLFGKPVVCVHPAVGNVMRQWPPGHFAELIDLLIEQDDVHVAVIGGPDEKEIAQAVIDRVHHPHAVFNMVGRLKLSELPQFIAQCQLFVGNNSGPKHIAAGVGIPTVGIHSGVVDAKEWGPLGPRAFAVQRDMSCHPCYMEKPDDCPRGIACLNGLRPGDAYRLCQPLLAPERARRRT